MPGATGDGTGFPQNFGTWWRSWYLLFNNLKTKNLKICII
jgi:hypothetical protein